MPWLRRYPVEHPRPDSIVRRSGVVTRNYVLVVSDDPSHVDRFGLSRLGSGWRAAFDEAWESWRAGNFGVGAALVDPSTGAVVASGRNRVAQTEPEPGVISGNMTAHAELNAFATLDRFNAEGLHLRTTLQPCLMCAASAMLLRVEHVAVAADDEFFGGLDDLWPHHPLTAARMPTRSGPFVGEHARLAGFARLLPMTYTLEHFPERTAAGLARSRHPRLATLADRLNSGEARELRRLPQVSDGLEALWDRLPPD